jgi:hypothetical protein
MFRKGKGEQRVCKVFDAPNLPEAEAISFTRVFPLEIIYIHCTALKMTLANYSFVV